MSLKISGMVESSTIYLRSCQPKNFKILLMTLAGFCDKITVRSEYVPGEGH
jgi:hypothetical protein